MPRMARSHAWILPVFRGVVQQGTIGHRTFGTTKTASTTFSPPAVAYRTLFEDALPLGWWPRFVVTRIDAARGSRARTGRPRFGRWADRRGAHMVSDTFCREKRCAGGGSDPLDGTHFDCIQGFPGKLSEACVEPKRGAPQCLRAAADAIGPKTSIG